MPVKTLLITGQWLPDQPAGFQRTVSNWHSFLPIPQRPSGTSPGGLFYARLVPQKMPSGFGRTKDTFSIRQG